MQMSNDQNPKSHYIQASLNSQNQSGSQNSAQKQFFNNQSCTGGSKSIEIEQKEKNNKRQEEMKEFESAKKCILNRIPFTSDQFKIRKIENHLVIGSNN